MKYFLLLFSTSILMLGCKENTSTESNSPEKKEMSDAEKIAEHYGISKFNDVDELQFTFNVDSKGNLRSRHYSWFPKTGEITLTSSNDTVHYNRNKQMDSIEINADKAFINDSYWLLAPFKLVWDEGAELSAPQKTEAPISGNQLNKITITYTGDGGYTPGDAYDFYYDDTFDVKEWVFRRGNKPEPSLASTWENEKSFDGLILVKDRLVPGEDWKIYFSDLNVKYSK